MPGNAQYAIVTPYYKEERRVIERCIASVRSQTVRTDHFLIADGFPQDWIDSSGVRHFKLDRSHGDNGNTPRGIGALLAAAEGYSGIGLLDADNWVDSDHVEVCLAAAAKSPAPCDYVIAQRTFRRPDETIMPIREERGHVDTSCFFFLSGAFSLLPHWAMMPRKFSPGCDRVFYSVLLSRGLVAARVESKPTVHFQTLYAAHYLALDETPPPGATRWVNQTGMMEWLRSLPPRENEIAGRLMGFLSPGEDRSVVHNPTVSSRGNHSLSREKVGRNDRCPCGSGRKYKHCHGASAR